MDMLQSAKDEARDRIRLGAAVFRERPFFPALVLVFIGIVDLFKAYRMRSISEAIVVVIVFFILGPAFSYWWSRRKHS
jgi:hypothetical protein